MNHNGLDDTDLDARVIRELARLPGLSPRSGFADRVMARVRPPQPKAVVLFHRARAWAGEPRRALALASAYAVSATAALAFLLPWLYGNSAMLRSWASWVQVQVLGVAREWALAVAGWSVTSGLVDWFRTLDVGTGQLAFAAVSLTAVYGACAFGLHILLRAPRGSNAPAQVR